MGLWEKKSKILHYNKLLWKSKDKIKIFRYIKIEIKVTTHSMKDFWEEAVEQ